MGIRYINLDETTRSFMLEESQLGGHYVSPRLTDFGKEQWESLLQEAIKHHDDDWLAVELLRNGYLNDREQYTRLGKTYWRNINKQQASEQLAEGEFNRYYLRGLCQRAKSEGISFLIIYRGKEVRDPRPESQAKIGTSVNVNELLTVLRSNDFVSVGDAMGVPGGPNSGITARLP